MNKIRKGFISSHVAFVYEDICREKMWDLSSQDTWPFYFSKIGRYWDSKTEIDVVALDPDGKNMILGECKYWKDPVGINILRDLEEKSKASAGIKPPARHGLFYFPVRGLRRSWKHLRKSARMFYWLAITKIDLCIPSFYRLTIVKNSVIITV